MNPAAYDVIIVGGGVAGAIIAKQLVAAGKTVLVLEAGDAYGAQAPDGLYPLKRFYLSTAKGTPEAPYTPDVFDASGNIADPTNLDAPRPTVLSLGTNWQDPHQSYFIQQGPLPFGSTYERTAGGTTRHWLGSSFRLCPNDFRMRTEYGVLVDWPIGYDDLAVAPAGDPQAKAYYERAETELGVSADVDRQQYLGITFSPGYAYPMPGIVSSLVDAAVAQAAPNVDVDGIALDVTPTPAARNSVDSGDIYGRPQCHGNTNCIPICPIQAKYDATATLGAIVSPNFTMWTNTVASHVVVGADGAVSAIDYAQYDPFGKKPVAYGSVSASRYVIAANAIETARLLLMSTNEGAYPNGVANSSGQVGKNLMDHPCYLAWAQAAEPVFGYRGPLSTSGIENARDGAFRKDRAAFRVEIGNDGWDWPTGDPYTTPLDLILGTNAGGLNPSGDVVFGTELVQRLNAALTRQFRVAMLMEQSPEDRNTVTLAAEKDGLSLPRPQITYDLSDYTKQGYVAAVQAASKLFEAMGATEFTAPPAANDPSAFTVQVDGKPVVVKVWGAGHIAGTYRMGSDKTDSVVDRTQRAWDHPNLFLVGSGVFPTIATGNPTLTIAALAFWAADTILADLT